MYYLLANGADPLRRWTPMEAIAYAERSTVHMTLFASIDISFLHQKQVLSRAVGCEPVDVDLTDDAAFDHFINSYRREMDRKTLSLDVPDAQMFMENVRRHIRDLLSAVEEKKDRIFLFSNGTDGATRTMKTESLLSVERALLFYGMRPVSHGFFDCQLPKSPFWYIPSLPVDPVLCDLRNAFANVNIERIKELFLVHRFTDESVGGLFANASYSLMFRSFPSNAMSEIEQILNYLTEESHADVNFVLAEGGGTVLHLLAAVFGNYENTAELIRLLKNHNVNLLKENAKGNTPFDEAKNHMQINSHVLRELSSDQAGY